MMNFVSRLLWLMALFFIPGISSAAPAPVASAARFSVIVEGEGSDVILIPGLASSRSVWDSTAARLKRDHRVHLVQVGGFAGEPVGGNAEGLVVAPLADAVADYIADARLKAPAVIGHSLGGEAALMLAARHPGAAGRLLIVDALPFYSLLFSPEATADAVRPRADAMRDMLLGQSAEQAAASQKPAIARLVKTESARAAAVEAGLASDRGVVARAIHELMVTDLRPELARVALPVMVAYAWDPAYGVSSTAVDGLFRTAYSGLAGTRFQRVDNSYHFIMIDRPDAFAAIVDGFLAE
jgi:pimeloyl-ACP methyl ester carboxylesterase